MIKLKSLFRRGQGPSGSSKQSPNANNQIRGAASTSSLNSIGLSTASSSSTATAAATPKSTKATLKKVPHTGSNDRFDSTFRESHESLDLKNSSSPTKLYSTSSGGESTSGFISSLANSKSHSSITVGNSGAILSTSPASTPQHNTRRTRNNATSTNSTNNHEQKQPFQTTIPMTEHSPDKLVIGSTTATVTTHSANSNTITGIGKVVAGELKDSDTEIGPDDGCASCYSSSMRDLLSDELPEDTFNGHDDIQVNSIATLLVGHANNFDINFIPSFSFIYSNIKSFMNYKRILSM